MFIASFWSSTVRKRSYALLVAPAGQLVTPLKLHGSSVSTVLGSELPSKLHRWIPAASGPGLGLYSSARFLGKGSPSLSHIPSLCFHIHPHAFLLVRVSLSVGNEAGGNGHVSQLNHHLAGNVQNDLKSIEPGLVVPSTSQVLAPSPLSPTGLLLHGLASRNSTHKSGSILVSSFQKIPSITSFPIFPTHSAACIMVKHSQDQDSK